ncbi:PTS sugar transporter subunit IIA [Thomasclavelia cocleata]|jgi:PTS system glucose-specific IIA component|uniref:PTS sugar transporter subunit IIA n=1 Tax=Thomasclavelia cocleata TaxID=69824 RepID=UPI00241C6574|nr:PTS glucose transporter subunit IIA [Thomasclavelia cocleata]MCI9130883.1 PTS glucose transporter subunit IIA [Thomasclavelia cocleata]MCI9630657.1 PTS glucose transporter subunit IIA [Thomasclavelia cocleata]
MGIFKKKIEIYCPIEGKVSPLEYCPDEVFSKGMTGEGVVIFPTGNIVYAPYDCKVEFIFESKHAIALKGSGIECLIHVGLDTNVLKGDGFKVFVEAGENVKQGDKLIEFDIMVLKKYHCIDATPFVFTNLNRRDITIDQYGMVDANIPFITIERK